ncbi:MAG: flagellar biosynthesis protein FlhF [Nitrospiraceae bacterium]|nr:MAG: flagellar biosynthesis protein FlhF [Nitrospiraceae bacterium]
MKMKVFHADTMHDAIRSIKEELGPNALILSTKRVRRGSVPFSLFGRSLLEVTAATDSIPDQPAPDQQATSQAAQNTGLPAVSQREPAPAFRDTLSAVLRSNTPPESGGTQVRIPSPATKSGAHSVSQERFLHLMNECLDLQQRLVSWLPAESQTAGLDFTAPLGRACRFLVAQGLRPSTAEQLCVALRRRLSTESLQSDREIQDALHHLCLEQIQVSGPLLDAETDYKVAMFVGPSGVGKTTSIVKLVAHYRLQENRSVALITLDTCRLAAVEHLRMYAKVLGVPLEAAQTTAEVLEGIRRHRHANLIMIDTPGFGPHETSQLMSLGGLKDSYGSIETHLVLSATTRMQDLRRTMTQYEACAPSRLLFTKLDETEEYGNLLELSHQTSLPLSYWSNGQRVPEDFEQADSARLADLLLDRGSARVTPSGRSSSIERNSVVLVDGTTPQQV